MKHISTMYIVAKWLQNHEKSYIHELKRHCKANNPMQRISLLRRIYGWEIATIYEGMKGRVPVYHYKVVKEGKMPKQFL